MTRPLLEVLELSCGGSEPLSQVSFSLAPGARLALVGARGSGLPSIPRALFGVDEPPLLTGAISIDGTSLGALDPPARSALRARTLAWWGGRGFGLDPALTLRVQLEDALFSFGVSRTDARARAVDLLRRVDLDDERAPRVRVDTLPPGARARAQLALALAHRPRLIVCEDPGRALDPSVAAQVLGHADAIAREDGIALLWLGPSAEAARPWVDEMGTLLEGALMGRVPSTRGARVRAAAPPPPHGDFPLAVVRNLAVLFEISTVEAPVLRLPRDLPDVARALFEAVGPRRRARGYSLHGLSLDIWPSEALGVLGEAGAGKTTLARTLALLQRPQRGAMVLEGIDAVHARGHVRQRLFRRVQLVHQSPFPPRAPLSASFSHALAVLEPTLAPRARTTRIADALHACGLSVDVLTERASALSPLDACRAAIARALVALPPLIVADEPTRGLDFDEGRQILALFDRLRRERGFALVLTARALAPLVSTCDRIVVLCAGRVAEIGDARSIWESPAHPATRAAVVAAHRLVGLGEPPALLEHAPRGDPPRALEVPHGCPFSARCPWTMDVCRTTPPALLEIGAGRAAACHALTDSPVDGRTGPEGARTSVGE